MRANGLRPNKRLGQNFLIDKNIVEKIIALSEISREDTVIELGAGMGNITADIAVAAKKVIAVEFDKGLCGVLRDIIVETKNIEPVCSDILKLDLERLARNGRLKVIGNLPYYITTPVLERLIGARQSIKDALLMVQRELGERLLAPPGSRRCGSISHYLRFYAEMESKCLVRKTCFFPRPDVDSLLLYIKFRSRPAVAVKNEELLFKIIRAAFNHRRKTILSSLSYNEQIGLARKRFTDILDTCGIMPSRRPESLTLEEFARISDGIKG